MLFSIAFGSGTFAQTCHTALVLALDTSDSVDAHKADLQRRGLADALRDPAVQAAIAPGADIGAFLMVFEWNDPDSQRVLAPWTFLTSPTEINAFATNLELDHADRISGQTGIGAAMRFAANAHGQVAVCDRRLIDISGDGPGNTGEPPSSVKGSGVLADIIVNGLVIRNPDFDSAQPPGRDPLPFYHGHIKHGPGSFVMVIDDFDDYAEAIRKKLLRELSSSLANLKNGGNER